MYIKLKKKRFISLLKSQWRKTLAV